MKNYRQLITQEADKLNKLHKKVHETFRFRGEGEKGYRAWEEACKLFHEYKSPLDEYFEKACNCEKFDDKDLLEFVVQFLEVDPWFFRSGYLKEIFLTKIKRSNISVKTKTRLRNILMDAVNKRGAREYKYYCRLAVQVADENIIDFLKEAEKSDGARRKNRALLMLDYIAKHKEQ